MYIRSMINEMERISLARMIIVNCNCPGLPGQFHVLLHIAIIIPYFFHCLLNNNLPNEFFIEKYVWQVVMNIHDGII